jgi:hypothetical protein
MKLKVAVDNVPVELEVVNVGPASLEKVEALKKRIEGNDLLLVHADLLAEKISKNLENKVAESKSHTPLEEQGLENVPQKQQIEEKQSLEGIMTVVDSLKEMFGAKKKKGMKPWYKSKTIISNATAAIGCLLGIFVSDNPETSMYLPASVIAFINVYLRSVTKSEIKLPMEDKIKRLKK